MAIQGLKNEFLNHIRHEAKFVDDPQLVFDKLHSDDNPINILIEEENMREIAIAISLLPINQRSVIMYRIYMQLTDKEISQIIGTSEVNIRKIRSRARQNLKKILEERNIGDRYDRQKENSIDPELDKFEEMFDSEENLELEKLEELIDKEIKKGLLGQQNLPY